VLTCKARTFIENLNFIDEGKGTLRSGSNGVARAIFENYALDIVCQELHTARNADDKLKGPETSWEVSKVVLGFKCAKNVAKVGTNTNWVEFGIIVGILV
jgi:hypothetical protein